MSCLLLSGPGTLCYSFGVHDSESNIQGHLDDQAPTQMRSLLTSHCQQGGYLLLVPWPALLFPGSPLGKFKKSSSATTFMSQSEKWRGQ
jgi:hypothetical protein